MQVGDKVVCVDDSFIQKLEWETYPVKGQIYIVRKLNEEEGVFLKEIVNPICEYLDGIGEVGFHPCRFRPVDYSFGEEVCEKIEQSELELA